jgi:hypothetical protein
MGSNEGTIQDYEVAVKLDPMNYWLWRNLCLAHRRNNDLDTAVTTCLSGILAYPTSPSPLMVLSNLYAIKGDFSSAIQVSTEAFKFKPAMIWLALECEDSVAAPNIQEIEAKSQLEL